PPLSCGHCAPRIPADEPARLAASRLRRRFGGARAQPGLGREGGRGRDASQPAQGEKAMTYLALHAALIALAVFLRLRSRAVSLRESRLALAAFLLAPVVTAAIPGGGWSGAPAQVWSGVASSAAAGVAVVQIGGRSMPGLPHVAATFSLVLLALIAAALLRDALGLRRKLRAAVIVR